MKFKQTFFLIAVFFLSASPASANPDYRGIADAIFSFNREDDCKDTALGYNTRSRSSSSEQATSSSKKVEGGGGVKVFGIGVNGNGGKATTSTRQGKVNRTQNSETVVRGMDCDVAINSVKEAVIQESNNHADMEINRENNETKRYVTDRQMRSERLYRRFRP